MIIKNNYNDKNANPLNNYNVIGKGSHSLDKELKREKEDFIKANMENPILNNLRDDSNEDDEPEGDNWKLFR